MNDRDKVISVEGWDFALRSEASSEARRCECCRLTLYFCSQERITKSARRKDAYREKEVGRKGEDRLNPSPEGLFTKDASTIARTLASKKVSPKGPGSGMRMRTYFINRAGSGLTASRRAQLEKTKTLLAKKVKAAKGSSST
jgi:hypothetical protein